MKLDGTRSRATQLAAVKSQAGGVAKNHYTASTTYKAAKNGYIVHVEYPETAFWEIQGGTNKEKVFSFLTEELA